MQFRSRLSDGFKQLMGRSAQRRTAHVPHRLVSAQATDGKWRATQVKPIVYLRSVNKRYAGETGRFTALDCVNFTALPGEFVSIIGRSGSGKSTLLNMVSGIDKPDDGEVIINDHSIHHMDEEALSRWRRKNIGIVFQFFQLMPTLTAAENVMLPMDFKGEVPTPQQLSQAHDLLSLVDMSPHADKLPGALSGGQQQRVAIARALANDPPLLVADEPTGNLDPKTAVQIIAIFKELAARGTTVLMVTHDHELAAQADKSITLANGRLVKGLHPTLEENSAVTPDVPSRAGAPLASQDEMDAYAQMLSGK